MNAVDWLIVACVLGTFSSLGFSVAWSLADIAATLRRLEQRK